MDTERATKLIAALAGIGIALCALHLISLTWQLM